MHLVLHSSSFLGFLSVGSHKRDRAVLLLRSIEFAPQKPCFSCVTPLDSSSFRLSSLPNLMMLQLRARANEVWVLTLSGLTERSGSRKTGQTEVSFANLNARAWESSGQRRA